ncbi:hypothetical protein LIER_35773 [Lithospermum erythrorhizon]|uniref:Uncharacterized protein n=1 Tax=Lithospermum erythrorhizon TaxID=34254 RepID=A0AAV3NXC4_LITER
MSDQILCENYHVRKSPGMWLFLFQIGQISFNRNNNIIVGSSSRLERELRLVAEIITRARDIQSSQSDEENFEALSMIKL